MTEKELQELFDGALEEQEKYREEGLARFMAYLEQQHKQNQVFASGPEPQKDSGIDDEGPVFTAAPQQVFTDAPFEDTETHETDETPVFTSAQNDENERILRALAAANNNKSRAAAILHMERKALERKLEQMRAK